MSIKNRLRGHEIEYDNDRKEWIYVDTKESIMDKDRPCNNCKCHSTPEGHDACLETLPNTLNACCGHGNPEDAYVNLINGKAIYGEDAIAIIKKLKKYKN